VSVPDAAKAAGILFLAAILQVSVFSDVTVLNGHPQLLLVTVVAVALVRGAVAGSIAGFCAGLLADTGVFGMLGFTSLLLTLAGYWCGRYGETTGRDRAHAPFLSVALVTVVYEFAALVLHFTLGQPAPAREVLLDALVPTVVLNSILAIPVYALVRRALRPREWTDRAREVRLLG
jgi:rod shape-determining protein MreD